MMKRIVVVPLLLVAISTVGVSDVMGGEPRVCRLPIKYWIEDIAFSSDKIITGIDVDSIGEEKKQQHEKSESRYKDNDRTVEKNFRADWDLKGNVSGGATGFSGGGRGEAGIGGGYQTKGREREGSRVKTEDGDTSTSSGTSTSTTTAQRQGPKLRFTLMFKNVTTNQTFVFFSEATSYSGMSVKSLDKSCPFSADVPLGAEFKLIPGGVNDIRITLPITAENDISALDNLKMRGALRDSIELELNSQFYLKDNNEIRWCMPSYSIGVYWDFAKNTKERRCYFVNGNGLSCENVLKALEPELQPGEEFSFSNGVLNKAFGCYFNRFDKDEEGIYVILAKVNGSPMDRLFGDTILSHDYDTKLRFVRVDTGELLRNRSSYSTDVIANCLSYIESSLTNSVVVSDKDYWVAD